MGPLSPAALAAFVKDGAVTVDTGVPDALIAAASAAVFAAAPRATAGATRSGRTCDFFDGPLLDVIGHPWFEQAAQHGELHGTRLASEVGSSHGDEQRHATEVERHLKHRLPCD